MKLSKNTFAIFLLIFVFSFIEIKAQNVEISKPVKILNNYGEIPFEDGKTIIDEVLFAGLDSDYEKYDAPIGKPIREKDLFSVLKWNKVKLISSGEKFHGHKVSKIVKATKKFIKSIGYPEVEVTAFGEVMAKGKMRLIISIERGTPILVSEIRFDGNKKVSNEELVTDLMGCLGDNWIEFQQKLYEFYTEKCSREYLFSKGFFKAKIKNVVPQQLSNGYLVKVLIEEGVRYRLGELNIKNAKAFSKKQIIEMLGFDVGDVVDGKKLREFLFEELKNKYADKGYLQYDVELNPTFMEPIAEEFDATVNIDINIDEGLLFKVQKIDFLGVDKEKKEQLKELIKIKEGEHYNRSKLIESVEVINRLKEFYPIDFDQDIETRISIISDTQRPTLNRKQTNGIVIGQKSIYSSDIGLFIKLKRLTRNEK